MNKKFRAKEYLYTGRRHSVILQSGDLFIQTGYCRKPGHVRGVPDGRKAPIIVSLSILEPENSTA